MNRKHIIIGIIVVLVAGLGVVALVKSRGEASESKGDETTPTIVTVQTGALKFATLHRYVQGYGTVEPAPGAAEQHAASAQLAAPASGGGEGRGRRRDTTARRTRAAGRERKRGKKREGAGKGGR